MAYITISRPELLKRSLIILLTVIGLNLYPDQAQVTAAQSPPVQNSSSSLQLPDHVNALILEFQDLECPACAAADAQLMEVASGRHIPLVQRDFLIPGHIWSPQAAVVAHWFGSKVPQLGLQYRRAVLANQQQIASSADLQQFNIAFASKHHLTIPNEIDPAGQFTALIRSDIQTAHELGVRATPTIFVLTRRSSPSPLVTRCLTGPDMSQCLDRAVASAKASTAGCNIGTKGGRMLNADQ